MQRRPWAVLAAFMVVAGVTILCFGRGTTFSVDGLTWVLQSPHLSLDRVLQPHEGHLVALPRLLFKLVLELSGTAYLPFRLLTLAALLGVVALVFVYARRRVGDVVALAPCLVLLFFGSDALHVLLDNGITVLGALACGVGALIALERRTRRSDLLACGLLCAGVLTYSVALAFLAAAAVAVLLGSDPRRRLWVPAIPLALYASWWLWSRGHAADASGGAVHLGNLFLLPSWAFQSLSAVLGSASGFDHQFNVDSSSSAGPVLAALVLAALVWRLLRAPVPASLWVALTVVVVLWALGVLSANSARHPDSARYLLPGAVALTLVAAEAASGLRWSQAGLVALFCFAAAGLAVNAYALHFEGAGFRAYAGEARATFGALGVAGDTARPTFELPPGADGQPSPMTFVFEHVADGGESPTSAYRDVVSRYGSLGYSSARILDQPEPVRAQVDAVLVSALGLKLRPEAKKPSSCRTLRADSGGGVVAELPRGGAIFVAPEAVDLYARRFAAETLVNLGSLNPGKASSLIVPADSDSRAWIVYAPTSSLRMCDLR